MSEGDWTTHQHHVRPSPDCHLCARTITVSNAVTVTGTNAKTLGTPPRMAIAGVPSPVEPRSTLGTTPRTFLDMAKARVLYRFETFANRIQAQEREDFFHPANASTWVNEFALWLCEEQDKYGASND